MQIKTITKTISNKLEEWLETITDEQLRKEVRKNVLVSGGSITSMLLNEQVNDYDVYIKDQNVLMKLVVYYTLPFKEEIEILFGPEREQYITDMIAAYNNQPFESIIGYKATAIRNLKDDQIKLTFNAKGGGIKVNEGIDKEAKTYVPVFFSPNAISLSNQIQIVIRFFGDDVAIHKTFDFIHATNYFTFESGLVTNIKALESILTKQLYYQGSQYPLTSIIRMKKFIKRGWNCNAGELLKIMFQISELDLQNPDVLEEQLIGIDVAYFTVLIEILRDLKEKQQEEKITSQYLNTIIDKVFNTHEDTE